MTAEDLLRSCSSNTAAYQPSSASMYFGKSSSSSSSRSLLSRTGFLKDSQLCVQASFQLQDIPRLTYVPVFLGKNVKDLSRFPFSDWRQRKTKAKNCSSRRSVLCDQWETESFKFNVNPAEVARKAQKSCEDISALACVNVIRHFPLQTSHLLKFQEHLVVNFQSFSQLSICPDSMLQCLSIQTFPVWIEMENVNQFIKY